MMQGDRIEAGKILVWGHIGQELKDLDPQRVLAIAQDDPKYFLSLIANDEIDDIIKIVWDEGLTPEAETLILESNKLQAIFEEVASFLHGAEDMLSTGSFLTGELKSEQALLRLIEEDR